ncbi:MAG: electron transfer flavoprotein subunit alpha [Rhodospirillaceae bacterium]|nr:electron transfer flavoprotein subunit alpha [Rhodospirillaceae bacterium]
MKCLVIAEHNNTELKASTLNVVYAAHQICSDVDILVAGFECGLVADAAKKITKIAKIKVCDNTAYQHQLAESLSDLVSNLAEEYTHILSAASTSGKNFMPRVAAQRNVAQISDISAIISDNTFERPIYAGNAIATVQSADPIKIVTIRVSAFEKAETGLDAAEIEIIHPVDSPDISSFVGQELSKSERPELSSANIVVSGGRGLGSSDNFAIIDSLADKLGAAVGASRAAVDAGYVPNDYQVGQTGKIIAPDLYVAIGISGAIQHLAGMKDSKLIVAINKDEEAPIFQVADYGLVGDLFELVPELTKELE